MENQIKYFRKINGISQIDLGRALNVTGATVSSWEQNRTEPNMEQSLKMAKYFGCTLEELFGSTPADHSATLSNEEELLIESYRTSDNQTKEMVKRILAYKELLDKKGE